MNAASSLTGSRSSVVLSEADRSALADLEAGIAALMPLMAPIDPEERRHPPLLSPRTRPVQVVSGHNDAQKKPTLITEHLSNHYQCSYEGLIELFEAKEELLTIQDDQGNTLLHEAIELVNGEDPEPLQLIAALLEAGAETDIENEAGQTAERLVIASKNSLLMQLFGLQDPSKEGLVQLLGEHNMHTCIDWIEMPDCVIEFEQEVLPDFVKRVTGNPVNVLQQLLTFYKQHIEVLGYVTPGTKTTRLHRAVEDALAGNPLAYFEVFFMLQAGLDRNALNCEQKTPLDLVDASGEDILKTLMAEPKPSYELFVKMARNHSKLKGWLAIKA